MSLTGWSMNDARLQRDDAHVYRLGDRELLGVTAILEEAGLSDFSAPWFSEAVKTRGQLVHQAIALDVEGDLDDETLDDTLAGYVAGWRAYRIDTGAIVEHNERLLCDPELGCAGTLDLIVRLPSEKVTTRRKLLDIKPALYPSVGPQTAAYARMAAALYDTPVYFQRAALVLPGDGSYKEEPLTSPTDDALFLSALRIVQFRRTHRLGRRAA